jgi:Nuclease-related domain/UvrD-like helicase C-terminal domain
MYPERLPLDVESEAERRLFHIFRTEFSDDFAVLCGVRWLARERGHGARDGEADFVVAHPKHGVLVLEVKGGGIAKDAKTGRWKSIDRQGKEHEVKDPFQQASRSMYELRQKLREAEPTRDHSYPMCYAVAFPDIFVEGGLGPEAPREIIIDSQDVGSLKQAIIDVFRYRNAAGDPPGDEGIVALLSVLASSWQIETTVGASLQEQESLIRLLTEQQFAVLDMLGRRRRALISGCAGSGKTMLAMEKAKRLAREGYRVLLTCYNQNLSNWMALQFPDDSVEVRRFLSLCRYFAQRAGIELEKTTYESDDSFFGRFPDALMDSLEHVPDRFDAIIVDEGQDFEEEWWVPLQELLADQDGGILYIFYDDNQRLYTRASSFPISEEPFHLTFNCRNTRQIHDTVMLFHTSDTQTSCLGPEGSPTRFHSFAAGADERREVEGLIDRLVTEESVSPGDIALLTRRSRERSAWKNPSRRPAWQATWELSDAAGKVLCSSVHGFKGLERPVVVVCELGGIDLAEELELFYVAFSRARELLIAVGLSDSFPAGDGP